MILLLAIVTAGVIPQPLIASESVAMAEVNHFYDENGKANKTLPPWLGSPADGMSNNRAARREWKR